MIIRPEMTEDYPKIRVINDLAFGRPNEADLVDALRESASPYISLVAIKDREVVGHIFFSPVSIESEECVFTAMGLAPMAVLPRYQKQGIGSQLVQKGLEECRRISENIVVVIGHPQYYPRFGFVPAVTMGLRTEYEVPDEAFMVIELVPGVLAGRKGLVKYRQEFNDV